MLSCGNIWESRRVRVMKKLDESKVKWIILQKQNGETTSRITETMNISTRWVKKLWARYRYIDPDKIVYPAPMGMLENGLPGRREHSLQCWLPEHRIPRCLTPARNHQGQYRNRCPLQQDTSDIERREPCIRASKEEQEA